VKIQTLIKKAFQTIGLDIRRYRADEQFPRCSLAGSLRAMASLGFAPGTILDVGAARGLWATYTAQVWPRAHFVMIDPIAENEADLKKVANALPSAEYHLAVAVESAGREMIHVHPDLDGSSLYLEREKNINGEAREVAALSLDGLYANANWQGPVLLKADTQGAEMRVLMGAEQVLRSTEVVILEVTLFDVFQGNPQLHEMTAYLKSRGFVTWDIYGMGYRPIDKALCQVDMVFVREGGMFRQIHQYATEEQREAQLQSLARNDAKRIKPGSLKGR